MSLLRRMMMAGMEEEEVEWKTLQEATLIGEDMRIIKIEGIPKAQEVMLVFFGRVNNEDDSLPSGNDGNSVVVNNVSGGIVPVAYIRPSGQMFYAVIRIFAQNGYIDGIVEQKGNNSVRMTSELIRGENIESIELVSNNLFKAESTVEVYYK